MQFAHTYLYYPYIRIPERTLIHSLLFQDRIKRIIPSVSQMDGGHLKEAMLPNAICRQYLGYDFIEDSDFWQSRDEIEGAFCEFLKDAHTEGNGSRFESLLGENFADRFKLGDTEVACGTQYFVYAEKFAPLVVETLRRFDWMRYDHKMQACEMRSELCNLYMAVLACSVSKRSSLPLSTDYRFAEEMTRTALFAEYFSVVLPENHRSTPLHDLALTLLVKNPEKGVGEEAPLPLESILTFEEAVRIRASLEDERRGFRSVVDRLVAKATAIGSISSEDFLKSEISDVLEAAQEYKTSIDSVAAREVAVERRDLIREIQTGISTLAPIAGAGIDLFTGASTLPGPGTIFGGAIALAAYIVPRMCNPHDGEIPQSILTDKQKAYLFMNRMWELAAART